jgi:predicted PurR-regulated permease PerM
MVHTRSANAVRYLLIGITLVATALLLWQLHQILLVAFGGIVVGTLVKATADPFRRYFRVGRIGGLACGLVALFLIVVLIGWLFGHQASAQAGEMGRLLPQQIQRTMAYFNRTATGRFLVASVRKGVAASPWLGGVGVAATAFMGAVLDAVLIVFLGIFFAWNPELYLEGGLRLLPPERRPAVRRAILDAGSSLRSWLLGQLISMAIIGTLAGTAYAISGVPLALALGLLAGVFEFIPVAGPILFGAVAILVGFSKGPRVAFEAVIVFVILQQIESNIIIPLVQRWAVRMPPALTILSVLAGSMLLGPLGLIFAVPLTVVAVSLIKHLYVENTLESA